MTNNLERARMICDIIAAAKLTFTLRDKLVDLAISTARDFTRDRKETSVYFSRILKLLENFRPEDFDKLVNAAEEWKDWRSEIDGWQPKVEQSSKPEGYPFLRIAKKYGVDYGDVLLVADWRRGDVPYSFARHGRAHLRMNDFLIIAEIEKATEIQDAIRRGAIDWQTGATRVPIAKHENINHGK